MRLVKKFQNSGKVSNNTQEITDDYVLRNYPIRPDVPLYMSEDLIRNGLHYWFMKGNDANVQHYLNYLKSLQAPRLKIIKVKPISDPKYKLTAGEQGNYQQHVDGNTTNTRATGETPRSAPESKLVIKGPEDSTTKEPLEKYSDFDIPGINNIAVNPDTELSDFIYDYKRRANRALATFPYWHDNMFNWITEDKMYSQRSDYLASDMYHDLPNFASDKYPIIPKEDFKNYSIPISRLLPGATVGGVYLPSKDKIALWDKDIDELKKNRITPVAAHEMSHWFRTGSNSEREIANQYSPRENNLLMLAYPMLNTFNSYGETGYDTAERRATNTQLRTMIAKGESPDPNRAIFGEKLDEAIDNLSDKLLLDYFFEVTNGNPYFMKLADYQKYGNTNSSIDQNITKTWELVDDSMSPQGNIGTQNNPKYTNYGDSVRQLATKYYNHGRYDYYKLLPLRYPLDLNWVKNLRRALKWVAFNNTNNTIDINNNTLV